MPIELTKDNFDKTIEEADIPVLVDFWAPWCGPCRVIAPYLEEITKEYKGKIKVCKVNVDQVPEIATRFQIMSIPALMIFSQGKVLETKLGSLPKQEIIKFIIPHLKG